MLRIRLARMGKKRQPSYRIVVAERGAKRDGRYVEHIGFYNPMTDPITYKFKEDRALHWLNVGAQPSEAVERLLKKQGTIDRLTRLRAGEEMGALVAEFEGTPWPPVAAEPEPVAPEPVVEKVVEEVAAEAEAVEEAVAEPEPEPVVAEPVVEEVAAVAAEPEAEVAPEPVAEAAPVAEAKADDLTKIEGVGPKISEILATSGFPTFASVAGSTPEALREVLAAAGGRYRMANPDTWPQQAQLAADGNWDALDELQDRLDGGRLVS